MRIDSGDLLEKSRRVREILDRHGRRETKIVASGDLNEYKVAALVAAGAPIDLFGVGTDLATSRDVPALSVVYKLVETERGGQVDYKSKFSEEKVYWPGRKQVFRFSTAGRYHRDLIARQEEKAPGAAPLLHPVMRGGRRLRPGCRFRIAGRLCWRPWTACRNLTTRSGRLPCTPWPKAKLSSAFWRTCASRRSPPCRCDLKMIPLLVEEGVGGGGGWDNHPWPLLNQGGELQMGQPPRAPP